MMVTETPPRPGPVFGPLELFVVEFTGAGPDPGVLAALRDLDASGTVRLVDLVVIVRTSEGEVVTTEVASDELGITQLPGGGLVGQDDIDDAATGLQPGHGLALAALEMRWAIALSAALATAGGTVSHVALIPAAAVNELVALAALTVEEN